MVPEACRIMAADVLLVWRLCCFSLLMHMIDMMNVHARDEAALRRSLKHHGLALAYHTCSKSHTHIMISYFESHL